jgi:hypothetical protein
MITVAAMTLTIRTAQNGYILESPNCDDDGNDSVLTRVFTSEHEPDKYDPGFAKLLHAIADELEGGHSRHSCARPRVVYLPGDKWSGGPISAQYRDALLELKYDVDTALLSADLAEPILPEHKRPIF